MRWLAMFATVALAAAPGVADPKPKTAVSKTAKPEATSGCKRRVVGRGLDRKVVCELAPIIVTSEKPKPSVVVVTQDGKNVTGRPKSTDPLAGLDHRLR